MFIFDFNFINMFFNLYVNEFFKVKVIMVDILDLDLMII